MIRPVYVRRVAAVALFAAYLVGFRWSGYYDVLRPIPWPWAITWAFVSTCVSLRAAVLIRRHLV